MPDIIIPSNPFTGTPIELEVKGPEKVKAGEAFAYTVRAKDIDQISVVNPTGIDAGLRIAFQIRSMSKFEYRIAPNPDSDKWMTCIITGIAVAQPGVYTDAFRAFNYMSGISTDPPVDKLVPMKVEAP